METLWNQLEDYIRSYLPHWQYDPGSGESEAALLRAAAELLLGSRERLDRLPERLEEAFLRLEEADRQGARPMEAYAALTAPQGADVPAGSEFYLSGDGTRLWRTAGETRAEPAALVDQVFVDASAGKLVRLPPPTLESPTRLFDFRARGDLHPEARFTHPDAFSVRRESTADLTLAGAGNALADFLSDGGQTAWELECDGPSIPLSSPARQRQSLRFTLPPAAGARSLLVRVRPGIVPPAEAAGRVTVGAERRGLPSTAVLTDDGVQEGRTVLPFGALPNVWSVCYLSCPDALSLRGARVTVSFAVSHEVTEELLLGMDRAPEYKTVMRRLPPPPPELRDVYTDQVAWEYWNGAGWRTVPETAVHAACFGRTETLSTRCEISFPWPEDASPCTVQGEEAVWLRWRVLRMDGAGWRPRRVHAPAVTELRFDAALVSAPVSVQTRSGPEGNFDAYQDVRVPLFPGLGPELEGWWLGFNRPPGGGLLRLYLELSGGADSSALTAWESTPEGGQRPLKLEDGTQGLSHSGLLTLRELGGRLSVRFGTEGWWLCLRDEGGTLRTSGRHPRLTRLVCGVVPLRAEGGDVCLAGERLLPLRGGALSGQSLTGAFGGFGAETDRQRLRRARGIQHHQGRAVSALDVDELIRATLRDVRRTRCVPSEGTVTVGVLMGDLEYHALAFSLRKRDIRRLLEERGALSTLGLEVAIRPPSFYPVSALLWVRPGGALPEGELQSVLTEALRRFLHPVTGHVHGRGWLLGDLPTGAQVRSYLQEAAPGADITKLLLTAAAPDGRELDCGGIHDPFALPLCGVHTIHLLRGEAGA